MKSIKIYVNEFVKKDGKGTFLKANVKGKYVPLAVAEEETIYNVRFVEGGAKAPAKAGIYDVAYEEGNLWIDSRPEYAEANILRVKAKRVVFNSYLPKQDK